MTKKRFTFNLNDFPDWAELNWINFEIDNTIDALRKSIEINQNAFNKICNDLEEKIQNLRNENKNLDPQDLDSYINHLHGLEERIIVELNGIQNSSTVVYAFAIFENKLKLITDKLKNDFEFELPNKKSDSYVSEYWKILRHFFGEKISTIEKYYTPLKNQAGLRNIIVHQNNSASELQYKILKSLKTIKFHEFEGSYYLVNIQNEYLEELVVQLTKFFKELIALLTQVTNEKLRNAV